jgi:pre-rRNA-processing protein IPI1
MSSTHTSSGQIEQTLQDLNIVYCELTSLLILTHTTQHVAPSNSKRRDGNTIAIQTSQVKDYIARLLSGISLSTHMAGRHITAQDYVALLPTLWILINSSVKHDSEDGGADTLSVLLDHGLQVSSTAAVKRPTADFLARLILVCRLSVLCIPCVNEFDTS